jgi:hypothetical protein
VSEIDKEDKDRILCKFLDGFNEDWYDTKEEKSEIRKCIPSEMHKRTHLGQIHQIQEHTSVSIQSEVQKPKESEEKHNKTKERRQAKREAEGGRKRAKTTK